MSRPGITQFDSSVGPAYSDSFTAENGGSEGSARSGAPPAAPPAMVASAVDPPACCPFIGGPRFFRSENLGSHLERPVTPFPYSLKLVQYLTLHFLTVKYCTGSPVNDRVEIGTG